MVTVVGQPTPPTSPRVVVGKPVVTSSPTSTAAAALCRRHDIALDNRNDYDETDHAFHRERTLQLQEVSDDREDSILQDPEIKIERQQTTSACWACIDPTLSLEDPKGNDGDNEIGKKPGNDLSGNAGPKNNANGGASDRTPSCDKDKTVSPLVHKEKQSPPGESIQNAPECSMFHFLFGCLPPASSGSTLPSGNPALEDTDDDDSDVDCTFATEDVESLPTTTRDVTSIATAPLLLLDVAGSSIAGTDPPEYGGFATVVENKAKAIKIRDAPEGENVRKIGKVGASGLEESADAKRNLLVKELKHAISAYGRYDIRCANLSAALGDLLCENGLHEQAVKLHKDAVTIYSCKLGDDNATTLDAKQRLGKILEANGDYDAAIETYYTVMAMRRALNGEHDPFVADGYVSMAQTLRLKKEYQQAIKELKRALRIYRDSLGDSDPKVSKTVDEIASLYVTVGDFRKAGAILEEVVKLKAATLGPKDPQVAATLFTLANAHECAEDSAKAMKCLKKAYKIYTETEGYSSESATSTLNRMATLYEATEDYNRASIAYLGVLRGRKMHYKEDNLVVGETYYKLGQTLHRAGQVEKSLKCMKEALQIYVKKSSELAQVETIAEIMHEMALINKEKKNTSDASRILKQELDVRRKIGQPEYPTIARNLNHLGVAEYELANHTRALKYFVEALGIFQNNGEDSLDCAEVLFNTGLVFEAVRNRARALEAYAEAARIFKENGYDDDHPHLDRAQHKVDKLSRAAESKESNSIMKRLFR